MGKILICDDDADILEMTSLCLSMKGFDVIIQLNSLQVIEQAIHEQPDLLLVDLWMPMLPGNELAIQIRQHPQLFHIPIIIFSASLDGQAQAVNAGVSSFISKPFDLSELVTLVESNILAA